MAQLVVFPKQWVQLVVTRRQSPNGEPLSGFERLAYGALTLPAADTIIRHSRAAGCPAAF
jgi:hypothetical protein